MGVGLIARQARQRRLLVAIDVDARRAIGIEVRVGAPARVGVEVQQQARGQIVDGVGDAGWVGADEAALCRLEEARAVVAQAAVVVVDLADVAQGLVDAGRLAVVAPFVWRARVART